MGKVVAEYSIEKEERRGIQIFEPGKYRAVLCDMHEGILAPGSSGGGLVCKIEFLSTDLAGGDCWIQIPYINYDPQFNTGLPAFYEFHLSKIVKALGKL